MPLLTLADAKLQLDIDTNEQDTELQSFVDAAILACEHLASGPLTSAAFTEWFDGGVEEIAVDCPPIVTVTAITEYRGVTPVTLTLQPLGGGPFTAYGYRIDDAESGVIRRVSGGWPSAFFPGRRNIKVEYNGGFATPPADANLAARIIAAHLWATQYGGGGFDEADEEVTEIPGLGFAVPNRAIELLGRIDALRPGFA